MIISLLQSSDNMKTLHLILITIICFCAVDFIIIQSGLLVQCRPNHDVYGAENLNGCEENSHNMQILLGFAGSFGIASLVGIFVLISRKASVVFTLSIIGLDMLFLVTYQIFVLTSTMPPGVMRQMSISDIILMDFIRSPLWAYLFAAAIFSSIVCPIVVFRKKIMRVK